MRKGHAGGGAARLAIAALVVMAFAGGAAGSASAASRRCTVKVGWYGWEGVIKEDTCANWVQISADCAFWSAGSNQARRVGARVKVQGWLTFATSCENNKPNLYPYTYLLVHHYHGSWAQVAVDGPFSPNYQVVTTTFREP